MSELLEAVGRISAVPTILRLITELTGLRLSMVAEVTESTWTCAAVNDQLNFGLVVHGQLDVDTTLCKEVRESHTAVVISHASEDPAYCDHRTPKMYAFESYISVPIFLRDRQYFGNLCALDSKPITLDSKVVRTFEVFAEMIGTQLELEASHQRTEQALLDERSTADLREQFIAVLGHDLRTPLSALTVGIETLQLEANEHQHTMLKRLERSTKKMGRMIEDVLDLARGRLGAGIPVELRTEVNLDELIRGAVDEARAAYARKIAIEGSAGSVKCDPLRVSQAVTNLLANAAQHGRADTPIAVALRSNQFGVEIAINNQGDIIPLQRISTMFAPYQRGDATSKSGLGLGLFIVSEIARAHRGQVGCVSTSDGTTFTLSLPVTD